MVRKGDSTIGIRRDVPVHLGDRSYTITIGAELIASGDAADQIATIAKGARTAIVTHPNLRALYGETLATMLRLRGCETIFCEVEEGETFKHLATVERLYHQFVEAQLDRRCLIIALGGGVIGDTAGFAAATYLRGLRLIQIPTTLLAQVDASIGGKTGVNLPQGKNLVGAFYQPSLVLIDISTLKTLPIRELRAGLAEVLKYGIIYDQAFFEETYQALPQLLSYDVETLTKAVARSCEIKAEVVAQDETEQGLRAILNFGHTLGHALEAATAYERYLHGEAVAIGMVAAALVGEEMGITSHETTRQIISALQQAGLPTRFPSEVPLPEVLEIMHRDKKVINGKTRFILARAIGKVEIVPDVPDAVVQKALERHRAGLFSP
ncbi:3-dehydroquinate synthase [Chthonomonas calidirosea]|uniref:3-dehydroquinate synthase n=1 Tax=Chthonomonas calidirosea TaxID=454171 RepID=UPI0006DD53E2|nr:3-dehydroquinate synthase [Chthonomonas calidirosea]CEK13093.1 3-dehydroquinate synthase [Chthonomonas calidirosea]